MEEELGDMEFTCKNCGRNKLIVLDKYSTITRFERVSKEDLKIYHGQLIEEWERTGELGDDHRIKWDGSPVRFGSEEEINDWDNINQNDLQEIDVEESYQERTLDEETWEVYVLCGGCNREIEFGWSHENRGGRIWPAECPDHKPYKSFPEPRYIESWREKGWLRPTTPRRSN